MKAVFTILLGVQLLASIALASNYKMAKQYKLTVINLTKGQPLTPPVVAVHSPGYQLIHLGEEASLGLGALAKDGVTDGLVEELNQNMQVVRSATGTGVILPGHKQEILVEANNPRFEMTVVSMLARTNDAISVVKNIGLHLRKGQKKAYLASTYDAGVEANTESCAHIPAPPCGNAMVDTMEYEGFIRPHEGFLGVGDLLAKRDAFADVTAKIIVERVR